MQYIVDAEWAEKKLNEITVIDCRFHLNDPEKGQLEYKEGHLPNAHYFDLNNDLSGAVKEHGGRHPLPDFKELHQKLEEAGVYDDGEVLLYDDQNGAMASRLWFLMELMGFKKAYILDGGFKAWKESGFPVSTEVPDMGKKGALTINLNESLLVDGNEVNAQLSEFISKEKYLIDARDPKRFQGTEEPIDKVAGHIPGAQNYFWMESLENGSWKSKEELKERFSDLDASKEIVVYCGSGVTACPTILTLKEAGFQNVKLYAGSWSDWISYENHPISKGIH
jgi:thiosulfate/3-mercaptopyruvate sulfurtransferase